MCLISTVCTRHMIIDLIKVGTRYRGTCSGGSCIDSYSFSRHINGTQEDDLPYTLTAHTKQGPRDEYTTDHFRDRVGGVDGLRPRCPRRSKTRVARKRHPGPYRVQSMPGVQTHRKGPEPVSQGRNRFDMSASDQATFAFVLLPQCVVSRRVDVEGYSTLP